MKLPKMGPKFHQELLNSLLEGVYCIDRNRKIAFWSEGAEKLTGYRAEDVVGTTCHDGLVAYTDEVGHPLCTSICTGVRVMQSGVSNEGIAYLRHYDGHRLPVLRRVAPWHDDAGNVIGAVELFTDASSILQTKREVESLSRAALHDSLTRVYNRRYAEGFLTDRLFGFERYGWPFGVLFVDIDFFKQINDQHGHHAGDEALRVVARTLTNSVRSSDVVARFGGDEFLVILSNLAGVHLDEIANKICRLVAQSHVRLVNGKLSVTVSIGGDSVPPHTTVNDALEGADAMLYAAKQAGRNCARCATATPESLAHSK